ncbi:putative 3-ketoacylthiolase b [Phaeomoniella chlamydospora]|uniref:acetyl-CoA C-acyltransferase n=1 Tax=Phaeomoniella chlamydospora TaxID=158046 RepID=A0A0G2GCX5_PHACM|nr:putative 3-ketoacylthiolase b [Phaeomoniella chlamydospora]
MAQIPKGLSNVLRKADSDIVILSSLRTPVTRAYKGGFKDAYPEELGYHVLKATLAANPNLDPALIDDVAMGSVLQELGGYKSGLHRQCSSGLHAITVMAHSLQNGNINIGIGGGMESMTRNYGSKAIPTVLWPDLKDSPIKDARDCIMSMGITSENVAERYGVSREDQDAFSVRSHLRASEAQKSGKFDKEIIPVTTRSAPADGAEKGETVTISKDDGIRHTATLESMTKLKPVFKPDGASTAGNSSQVSDGAAATLMMRRSTANELGLSSSIIGKWVHSVAIGCTPDEMGVGPAIAIPKLLDQTGLQVNDINVWEINEAFASQAIYCVRKLEIDEEKVNPNGGAIALGHPLGATGARQLATLLPELERRQEQLGVISMCIGTGAGMAALFVKE